MDRAERRGDVRARSATAGSPAFSDPQLDALVREALANNPDLRVAAARVEQAAGYVKVAGATLYPQVNALARGGGALERRLERPGRRRHLRQLGARPLGPRARRARVGARRSTTSAALDAEYARQSIAALVAKSWFLATEARMQKAIAEEMAGSSEQQLVLAQDRLRIGRGDEYDVALVAGERRDVPRHARAASTSLTSRRCARSKRSPAAIRPRRSRCRRSSPRCPGRCRSACRRSCSSAVRT